MRVQCGREWMWVETINNYILRKWRWSYTYQGDCSIAASRLGSLPYLLEYLNYKRISYKVQQLKSKPQRLHYKNDHLAWSKRTKMKTKEVLMLCRCVTPYNALHLAS